MTVTPPDPPPVVTCQRVTGTRLTTSLHELPPDRRGDRMGNTGISHVLCGAPARYVLTDPVKVSCARCLPAMVDARVDSGVDVVHVRPVPSRARMAALTPGTAPAATS